MPTDSAGLAQAFEQQRPRLLAIAQRMLGSRADAEDAVQDAWLRLSRQDPDGIDNLAGWLTTVVGRVSIDMLRARAARPQAAYPDLAELLVVEDDSISPETEAVLAESVGLALLVVLETLTPVERLALILHDMFAVPFDEIGEVLGRSADASKMLASRARGKVQGAGRPSGTARQKRAVVDAFIAAAREGDMEALLKLLDPDVSWHTHTSREVIVRRGRAEVIELARRGARAGVTSQAVLVNGEPGVLARAGDGTPLGLMVCTVADGRVTQVLSLRDTDRLTQLDLPEPR